MDNEYCAIHWRVPVNTLESSPSSNLVPTAMASGSCQSSVDRYDLCSDDEEYLTPNNLAEMTSGRTDHKEQWSTAARLYLNSPPEVLKNWGQLNSNLNDDHSFPIEISSTFSLPDTIDWWRRQEEKHSKYADLSQAARDKSSIILPGVAVLASISLGRDGIG